MAISNLTDTKGSKDSQREKKVLMDPPKLNQGGQTTPPARSTQNAPRKTQRISGFEIEENEKEMIRRKHGLK